MQHERKDILLALSKAKWTLEKVIQMTEGGTYCADIAHQINASIWLLKSANRELMRDHLRCCGREKLGSGDMYISEKFIDEFIQTWDVATRK